MLLSYPFTLIFNQFKKKKNLVLCFEIIIKEHLHLIKSQNTQITELKTPLNPNAQEEKQKTNELLAKTKNPDITKYFWLFLTSRAVSGVGDRDGKGVPMALNPPTTKDRVGVKLSHDFLLMLLCWGFKG